MSVDVDMVRWRRRGVDLAVAAPAAAAVVGVGMKSVRQQHARAASGRRDAGRDIAVEYGSVYPRWQSNQQLWVVLKPTAMFVFGGVGMRPRQAQRCRELTPGRRRVLNFLHISAVPAAPIANCTATAHLDGGKERSRERSREKSKERGIEG